MSLKVSWSAVVFVPGGQLLEVDSRQQGQRARTLVHNIKLSYTILTDKPVGNVICTLSYHCDAVWSRDIDSHMTIWVE